MRPPTSTLSVLLGILILVLGVSADEISITDNRQVCSGIYSKKDWNGPSESFIDVVLKPKDTADSDDSWIALIVFEYRDVGLIGVDVPGDGNKKFVCDDTPIAAGLCTSDQLGTFIVQQHSNSSSYAKLFTEKINVKDPQAVRYPVAKSGYYCVSTYPSSSNVTYDGVAVYQNAFGKLPASQVPKLSFFGGAAIAYLVVFCFWMFSYIQHRADVLPVQNYITAICGFLVIEMVCVWGYYDYVNNKGDGTGSFVYLAFLSVLDSIRNAFTFFLLLIVCLGYGVVLPSLGKVMWKCRALGAAHFLFALLYTVTTYLTVPDEAGIWVLFCIVPLAMTMTAFYVWILSALTFTIKSLEDKKQVIKANMYKWLWRILLGSILVIFAFFFINSMVFSQESTLEFITTHWKSRWFMFDGWLNVVYFVDFCAISFIWRPTNNNRRFAMSSQLAQDENDAQEFEIDSFDMGDDDDDEERNVHGSDENPFADPAEAATPSVDSPRQHDHNTDGTTMFAVEDEDYEHRSDDEGESHEGKRMIGKGPGDVSKDNKDK